MALWGATGSIEAKRNQEAAHLLNWLFGTHRELIEVPARHGMTHAVAEQVSPRRQPGEREPEEG